MTYLIKVISYGYRHEYQYAYQ